MNNVFLAPRSNENSYENFKSTITFGVERERIWPYLTEEEKKILGDQKKFYVWGNLETKRSSWEKMQIGDLILFYVKGRFVYAGKCQFKKYDQELSLKLWPPAPENEGRTWSCLFFVNNLTPVNIPLEEIKQLGGYADKFIVQGFMPLNKSGVQKLHEKYGTIDKFIEIFRSGLSDKDLHQLTKIGSKEEVVAEELEQIDSILSKSENIDHAIDDLVTRNVDQTPDQVMAISKRIKRDYALVNKLKKIYGYKCQICGFTFKTKSGKQYSEVAHIKPMSSREKGVDVVSNMLVLCPNHHKMLDLAFVEIGINKELIINGISIILKEKHHDIDLSKI